MELHNTAKYICKVNVILISVLRDSEVLQKLDFSRHELFGFGTQKISSLTDYAQTISPSLVLSREDLVNSMQSRFPVLPRIQNS